MVKKTSRPIDGDIINPDGQVFEAGTEDDAVGRPEHVPTERNKGTVEAMSGLGLPHRDIAEKIGISAPTLRKHYRSELLTGDINFKAKIAQTSADLAFGSPAKYDDKGNLLQAERPPSEKMLLHFLKTRLHQIVRHEFNFSGDRAPEAFDTSGMTKKEIVERATALLVKGHAQRALTHKPEEKKTTH